MGSQRIELNTCKKGFLSTHREGANPRKPFISSLFGHAAALEGFFYCIKICIYIDPAAGGGSLLIRAADEAQVDENGASIVTIFGQEKYPDTAGLAKMNFILHNKGTGEIKSGNTLSSPQYLDEFGELKKFDFIVMNPPFSDKAWTDGIKPSNDKYKRFDDYGIPPEKNGDYAWFLHVLKSLNQTGKAGIVMPHGVLFRGNSEETIRKKILAKKWIKGIVSLPANLFYGTGIPACIIIIDKENAESRTGIFMIDASSGYKKDGSKNRLREQDIEKIVRYFNGQIVEEGYSRFVTYKSILEENDGNLNIPRYITKIDDTLPQNIAAHLNGGIPKTDIDSLEKLWTVAPELKSVLFSTTALCSEIAEILLATKMPWCVAVRLLSFLILEKPQRVLIYISIRNSQCWREALKFHRA